MRIGHACGANGLRLSRCTPREYDCLLLKTQKRRKSGTDAK